MTNNPQPDFFARKHERLSWFARLASFFAWSMLVISIIQVPTRVMRELYIIEMDNFGHVLSEGFYETLVRYPMQTASLGVEVASILLRGAVFWVGLKGISLGLNMLIEIDLSHAERNQGVGDV